MSTIAKPALVTLLVISLIAFGSTAIFASTEVEVVEVTGSCDQGNVATKVLLYNGGEQDKSFKVILRLTQLVPPASEFTLVEETAGKVVVFAGEEGVASYTFFTFGVDPSASQIRVEAEIGSVVVSEGFPPCFQPLPTLPSPALASPVPTATPTRISEIITILATPVATVSGPVSLPNSGTGGDEEVGWKSGRLWPAVAAVILTVSARMFYLQGKRTA